ncbi:MAG: hypothetical protein DRN78_04670 [Thermoproteota archaeon]|nr:MAG: hypothetical protein DRN78_04670 [Candidatus Korarchaeota archaeon]
MDLKVLQVIQFPLGYKGGPAIYVRELSKYLAKAGVEVGILHPEGRRAYSLDPVESFVVRSSLPKLLLKDPWVFSALAHKYISSLQGKFDLVHIHLAPVILQLAAGMLVRPIVSTIHGWPIYEDYYSVTHEGSVYSLFKLVAVTPRETLSLLKLIEGSKLVATVSKHLRNILEMYNPLWADKLDVLYNGVDTNFFYPRRSCPSSGNQSRLLEKMSSKPTILYLGRVIPRKGIGLLLKAASKIDKMAQVVIAGRIDPSYERRLRKLASSLGIEDIVAITGELPRRLLPYFYSMADVYVLPSLFEGLPTTLLEAMACGTPVIATRVGGIPEVVDHGRNGFLIGRGSLNELRDTLRCLLDDESLRKRMSIEAERTVKERFSWDIISKRYIELYTL